MNCKTITRTSLAVLVGLIWTGSAVAQLTHVGMPGKVRNEHPRIYATQADLERIRQEANVGPAQLPTTRGTIKFTLVPTAKGTNDKATADLFGQQGGTADNRFYMRYTEAEAPAGRIKLQIVAANANAATTIYPKLGEPNEIEFGYDIAGRNAWVLFEGQRYPFSWPNLSWTPVPQTLLLGGHEKDQITQLTIQEGEVPIWHSDNVDLELHRSWRGFLANADASVYVLNTCEIKSGVATPEGCDRTSGGRARVIETAQRLTLAYRLTGNAKYLAAARQHIDFIVKVSKDAPTSGGEWDMAARVGALGLYYDWMHERMGEASDGKTYGEVLKAAIKKTIVTKNTAVGEKNNDLVYSVCGSAQTVVDSGGVFDCAVKPALTVGGGKPTIADTYISGHTQAANNGVAMGLLALADADDAPEVLHMLDTIYDHYAMGFWRARDFYSKNGGAHTLYSYSGSGGNDTIERLAMWKRALEDGAKMPDLKAPPLLIYPYIYALRSDRAFPARSDFFRFDAGGPAEMALAAIRGNADGYAAYFYDRYVVPTRNIGKSPDARDSNLFWERLLYPYATVGEKSPHTLPLSRHFLNAGNVIMRDTWDYTQAAVVDFKSSSFITVNHHHMDQNSYSLFYRAPLLVDSGQYDRYGSNHWHNYYIRSIAHNTLTVFDPNEPYALGNYSNLANDGGQWPGKRNPNPSLETVDTAGSPNALDGVTAYEESTTGDYAYVLGNASKAYAGKDGTVGGKLDSKAGFLRSMVYLRPEGAPPKVIVFDAVRPVANGLEITSHLHSVEKPESTIVPSKFAPGRYRFGFLGGAQPLTIRNGKGMVTVQTLLPADPDVVLSGGLNNGDDCTPAADITEKKTRTNRQDCRFLVRQPLGNGAYEWQNFAALEPGETSDMQTDSPTTDMGAWRVEISPKTAPAAGSTVYFLNVLHTADNDKLTGAANIAADEARLLSNVNNTVAVALKSDETFVFASSTETLPAATWQPAGSSNPTLVFGLARNQGYSIVPASAPAGAVQLKADVNGQYRSSDAGVLKLNRP